jgi:hypothetical protein
MLEQHADVAPEQRELGIAGDAVAVSKGEAMAANLEDPRLRNLEQVHTAQEGRLSRTVCADQPHHLVRARRSAKRL